MSSLTARRSCPKRSPAPAAGTPTGCPYAARTRCRARPADPAPRSHLRVLGPGCGGLRGDAGRGRGGRNAVGGHEGGAGLAARSGLAGLARRSRTMPFGGQTKCELPPVDPARVPTRVTSAAERSAPSRALASARSPTSVYVRASQSPAPQARSQDGVGASDAAASQANPSGSVKVSAVLPRTMRCEPVPSAGTPRSLARARRLYSASLTGLD